MRGKVYITSDLHFGHNNILRFQPNRGGDTAWEHDKWIISQWNSIITKKDTVYILGDAAFNTTGMKKVAQLRGNKILVGGNHDRNLGNYTKLFSSIHGCRVSKGYWLTHIPIHPTELRGRKNIHGHTHDVCIPDSNYINVSVDMNGGIPVLFQDIIDGKYTTHNTSEGE